MPQISDQNVKNALEAVGDLDSQSAGPLLRADQLEEIRSIARETDVSAKAQRTSALMQRLLDEATAGNEKLRKLLSQFGLDPEMTRRFLSGDRLNSDARRTVQSSLDAFRRGVEDAAANEARQAGSPPTSVPAAARSRMRV